MSDQRTNQGPERRQVRQAGDLLRPETTQPARIGELARWSGLSENYIREDIRLEKIVAIKMARHGRYFYVVPVPEAIRYLRSVGVSI